MTMQDRTVKHWNLFARELTDILAARNIPLEQLHLHISILPDKVRRLQLSLFTPHSFPVLSQDEINQLVQACGLTETELLRLRAALIATAIEKLLIDRLQPDAALQAANVVFPIIANALQQVDILNPFDTTQRGDLIFAEDDESDLALAAAWHTIDSGTLALNLSYQVVTHSERLDSTSQARQKFEQALAELDEVEDDARATQTWNNLYAEAERCLQNAQDRLEDLGDN